MTAQRAHACSACWARDVQVLPHLDVTCLARHASTLCRQCANTVRAKCWSRASIECVQHAVQTVCEHIARKMLTLCSHKQLFFFNWRGIRLRSETSLMYTRVSFCHFHWIETDWHSGAHEWCFRTQPKYTTFRKFIVYTFLFVQKILILHMLCFFIYNIYK